VRFWTWKFSLALLLVAVFVLVALPLGLATDPDTGEAKPLLPTLTESGVASFVFLLLIIYVISHSGGWVLAKFRDRGKPPPAEETKSRRGRTKPPRGRK